MSVQASLNHWKRIGHKKAMEEEHETPWNKKNPMHQATGSLHLVNQRMTVGVDLALDQHVGIAVAEALVDLIAHKVEVSHPGLQWSKRRNEPLQLSGMLLGVKPNHVKARAERPVEGENLTEWRLKRVAKQLHPLPKSLLMKRWKRKPKLFWMNIYIYKISRRPFSVLRS
nr:uncharacterized protein LOC117680774 isoform X1 [Crassostrea gigas]